MVQTGMAAPYGGGVFSPPVNGVAGVVGSGAAGADVKSAPVSIKEESPGAQSQPQTGGPPTVQPPTSVSHNVTQGPTPGSYSPPNGVDQQAIVSIMTSIDCK